MGDWQIFKKPAATLPLIKIYQMSLISTGSISLDNTFKFRVLIFTGYDIIPENIDNAKKNYSRGMEK